MCPPVVGKEGGGCQFFLHMCFLVTVSANLCPAVVGEEGGGASGG